MQSSKTSFLNSENVSNSKNVSGHKNVADNKNVIAHKNVSDDKNIILIGMPGAGKSTVGVVLAKMLNYEFIDVDLVIQQRMQKTLQQLIDDLGTEGFIALEGEILTSLSPHRAIVSTGGSAIYSRNAIDELAAYGRVVYLQIALDALRERLGDLNERGVVIKDDFKDVCHDGLQGGCRDIYGKGRQDGRTDGCQNGSQDDERDACQNNDRAGWQDDRQTDGQDGDRGVDQNDRQGDSQSDRCKGDVLAALFAERVPLYEDAAEFTICVDDLSISDAARAIRDVISHADK